MPEPSPTLEGIRMWWHGKSTPKSSVRIVAVPPGDAPLWVREKRVGLELPLTRWDTAKAFVGFGAVSGPRTWLAQLWALARGRSQRIYGYAIDAARAVEILDHASPEAAAWWRTNAAEFIMPTRYLIFHAEACERVLHGAG